jgi:hypothetical protein
MKKKSLVGWVDNDVFWNMLKYGIPDNELMFFFYPTKKFHGIPQAESMSKVRITIKELK